RVGLVSRSGPLWVADSKLVYRPAVGLAALELGVQAALGCAGALPRDWTALWPMLTGLPAPCAAADPCCADFNCALPLAAAAAALSHVTIALVATAFESLISQGLPPEPAWIVCDKHGGRNRYSPLLQQRFPETLIEVRGESRARSVYRWRHGGEAVETHFCAR